MHTKEEPLQCGPFCLALIHAEVYVVLNIHGMYVAYTCHAFVDSLHNPRHNPTIKLTLIPNANLAVQFSLMSWIPINQLDQREIRLSLLTKPVVHRRQR